MVSIRVDLAVVRSGLNVMAYMSDAKNRHEKADVLTKIINRLIQDTIDADDRVRKAKHAEA